MIEFQEYPKMLYHPETGAQVIVRDADQEADQLDAWGDAPKIPLKASVPKAAPKPKASRAAKPKAN